ncbi:hypothetical protein KSS87_010068 [Heliosperma pusillum]|nr:hypothetical protein KSS87_010068 [Heliosperma pusillum]
MRVKDMHQLCCITLDSGSSGGGGNPTPPLPTTRRSESLGSDTVSVAGPLYKWTNYGKGWRSRWFLLRGDGGLSYTKILSPQNLVSLSSSLPDDVTVIGDLTSPRLIRIDSCSRRGKYSKKDDKLVVNLEVSTFRGSRSDDRRFYIFTATKTLHLRTNSKHERELWLKALAATRSLYSLRRLNDSFTISPSSISISTERLKKRLVEDGANEFLVNDCEQIMLSEFTELQGHLKVLCEERSCLLDTLRQLEAANIEGMTGSEYPSTKLEYSGGERGKYSECSTTESSDDTEKQEFEEASEEDDYCFYDSKDYFTESLGQSGSRKDNQDNFGNGMESIGGLVNNSFAEGALNEASCSNTERRTKLPDPIEKEKAVSLWSMIKDNVGKDLTRVCLPVYFNEPISSLQKCCEDMEYSDLLDRAYEYGKVGNSLMRIVNVAAFSVSGYASTEGRLCKPFNPLLGETYEADYPEKGFRFFSEKVSHHPTLIACHCEGRGWKFWADSNIKSRFWGQSIQLDPVGLLTLEFDDGEIFQWSKIHGFVEDVTGNKVGTVFGKWDDSIYFNKGDGTKKLRDLNSSADTSLVWRRVKPTPNLTRYNLTNFAITLNELTPGLEEKLPPTDSRLRPDQRHLENGEYDQANTEKLRLERRQRMSRKLQEDGWKPKWFEKEGEEGTYNYKGGYWEAREQGNWNGCPNIFGEIRDDVNEIFED